MRIVMCCTGDTHPTKTLNELAKGTDVLIQQIMGPLPAFNTLSYESQYLLNVSTLTPYNVLFLCRVVVVSNVLTFFICQQSCSQLLSLLPTSEACSECAACCYLV